MKEIAQQDLNVICFAKIRTEFGWADSASGHVQVTPWQSFQ
jgi:hypothetical protein